MMGSPNHARTAHRGVRFASGAAAIAILAGSVTAQTDRGREARIELLDALHEDLERDPDPSRLLASAATVCDALLELEAGTAQGEPVVRRDWRLFSPVWAPFAEGLAGRDPGDPRSAAVGVSSSAWGTDVRTDVFHLFALLRLCEWTPDGRPALSGELQAAFQQAWMNHRGIEGMPGYSESAFRPRIDAASRWVEDRLAAGWIRAAVRDLRRGPPAYPVLSASDVPDPGPGQPLARSFRRLAVSGPDRYAEKWFWHGRMLDQMIERASIQDRERAAATLDAYIPWYLLLCHAGQPVSVFKSGPPVRDGDRFAVAFTRPHEEDIPFQNLYAHASHLYQAGSVRYHAAKLSREAFNPVAHMVCFPFDVLVDRRTGSLQFFERPDGFLGYIDAFAEDGLPTRFAAGTVSAPPPAP